MIKLFCSANDPEPTDSKNLSMKTLLIVPKLRNYITTIFSIGVVLGTGIGYGIEKVLIYRDRDLITLLQYERVKLEMSLEQVELILGSGKEISQSDSVTVFKWKNSDDSFTTMFFKDGHLVRKAQTDLT
ncbi:hypothetical protein [cf. Phormidesmis sp. LEGE 11477]|uniref:hypothetical protein n=1 Tax=cf. Phormidesmis sp. LEGE 11477 TaxID=1828680 RepID=UPI001880DD97|nr:hypothetical protein [cf. Phormidesmis sp. LEGE 11477]MBE9062480.1 hypothetical protein [cf. Phormidesmis sp. LEGE 11477]